MVNNNRNLYILSISQLISGLGWWVTTLGLSSFILFYKEYSTNDYGFMMFFNTLPIFIFGYLGGKISEKINKRKALVVIEVLRGIVVGLIPLSNSIYEIYFLVFLNTSLFTIFRSSLIGITKELFSGKSLLKINSIFVGSRNIGMIIGPSILSLILISGNYSLPFYVDTFTYFASALILLFLNYSGMEKVKSIKDNYNFKDIIKYILENKLILNLFLHSFLYSIISGIFNVGWHLFIKEELGKGAEYISFFQILIGMGSILGVFLVTKFSDRIDKVKMLYLTIILYPLSMLSISINNIKIVSFSVVVIGIAFSTFTVLNNTLVQSIVDKQIIGRVFSFFHSIQLGMHLIWSSSLGLIMKVLPISKLFLISSIIILLLISILQMIMFPLKDYKLKYS